MFGMKFAASNGASPATYGLAITATCLLPMSVAVGPMFSGAETVSGANPWVSWGTTVLAVYGAQWLDAKDKGPIGVIGPIVQGATALALHSCITSHCESAPLKVVSLNAVSWLLLYHFRTLSKVLYDRVTKSGDTDLSDHACHAGGSVAGLAAAAAVVHGNPLPEGTFSRAAIGVSLAYLLARFYRKL